VASRDLSSVVIVGAGQAGGRAAEAVRAAGFAGAVTLIGKEMHPPYERPQLSKALLLEPAASPAYLRPSTGWSEIGVNLLTDSAVAMCDAERRSVTLADGREFRFDRLLLATGLEARRLPSLESAGVPVRYLRSLDDALRLREEMNEGCRLALVGGGVIGLEVAAAAIKRGCSVTVIEASPDVLPQIGSKATSAFVAKLHRDQGTKILTGVSVISSAEGVVQLSDGTKVSADLILVGIGVEPAPGLASLIDIPSSGGIRVDQTGETDIKGIYAAGDIALQWNRYADRWMRIENWANAQNQAAATARSMIGLVANYDQPPWFWTDQHEVNLQVAGSLAGTHQVVRGDVCAGRFCVIGFRDDEMTGAACVNSPRDMGLLRRAIAGRKRVNPGDVESPDFDLKRILSN
jgi:p-cumate 2,3-dioxygenase ferredoxin reductase component